MVAFLACLALPARAAAANKTACEATCKDLCRQIAQIDAATAALAGGADAPR